MRYWWTALSFFVMMAGFMLLMQWLAQPKPSVPSTATRPRLFPWGMLNYIELETRNSDRHRLRANHNSWVHRRRLIDVQIDGSRELADQMCDRISQCSGQWVIRRA
jgi:hypothetical protein